jgi:thiamine pyrophosphate-dependent acetolactate synthase large subunit-like protein
MTGAEKVLAARHVVSMSGDGAFTMLMGDTSWSQCSVDA